MRGNPDKIKGKGFRERPENINRKGRPPKLFSDVNLSLTKKGYSPVTPSQLKEAYEMLLNLPFSELLLIAGKKIILNGDELKNNIKTPIILSKDADEYPYHYRQIAQALLNNKFGFEYSQSLIDRAQGKAKQSTEFTGDMNIKWIEEKTYKKE